MASFTIRLNTILLPFYELKFELAGYVILDKLLGLVLAIVGRPFQVDAVAEMFFYEQYRATFLILVAECRQTTGIDKRAFLGEVVAQVCEDFSFLILHVTRNPEILL